MAEPVIGTPNGTGGTTNEWDVYYWRQANGKSSPGSPYTNSGGVAGHNSQSTNTTNDKINSIYGSAADNLGDKVGSYMDTLNANRTKNVANAEVYNQQAGRERAIAKTKSAISGVNTSGQDEQDRRNSVYGAATINETAQRTANSEYGKAVGNVIGGKNKIEQQAIANELANRPVPVAQEKSGGLFDTLFGWLG
jgi:hypothetical protein